jgi:hypothetical protein
MTATSQEIAIGRHSCHRTFFESATVEDLEKLGDHELRPELAAMLASAEEQAELAFAAMAEQPRQEFLISKAVNSAKRLTQWHFRLHQEKEAKAWLARARDAKRAPGMNRTASVLASIAILESESAEELPEVREEEIGDDAAAKLYVRYARSCIDRGDSVEAARLASRASLLLDRNERACDIHVVLQRNRALIEKVLGQADLAGHGNPSGYRLPLVTGI